MLVKVSPDKIIRYDNIADLSINCFMNNRWNIVLSYYDVTTLDNGISDMILTSSEDVHCETITVARLIFKDICIVLDNIEEESKKAFLDLDRYLYLTKKQYNKGSDKQ